jgi:hypothetical protein
MVPPPKLKTLPEGEVKFSTIEETITENYEMYYKISNRLEALQKWIKDQQEANK